MVKENLQPNEQLPSKSSEPDILNAPRGTYEYLEQIGNYQFTDPIDHTRAWVLKEEVCQETCGSCMDFVIRERTDAGGTKESHAHVTQDDKIFRLSTSLWESNAVGHFEEGPTPDIEDMLSDLKNMLSRKEVKKYPR